jgi:DNA-directed RNA polymerase specialized sigma24 family protein
MTTTPKKPKNYLNNKDLCEQIRLSKEQGKMTDELAKMCMALADRYSKHPNFANIYSYKEDMVSSAYLALFRNYHHFNQEKYSNAFAYLTQICKHQFYHYLNMEKKQRTIRDAWAVDLGVSPDEYESSGFDEAAVFGQSEPKLEKDAPALTDDE